MEASHQYCTACGLRLDGTTGAAARGTAEATTPPVDVQLLRCPSCGGVNAASRTSCGRCRADLRTGVLPGAATPVVEAADGEVRASRWRPLRPESTGLLLLGLVLAGLVAVGVVLVVLGARGLGLFDREGSAGALPAAGLLSVRSASASSTAEGSDPAGAIDPDSSTAWVAGAAASGEWLELELVEPAPVQRVVVRTGTSPTGDGRVRRLDIALGGRTFQVELLDLAGAQRVALPEPVVADRVRFTVGATYGDGPAALREVLVFGDLPATPAPS